MENFLDFCVVGATQGHAGDIVVTFDSTNNRTVVDLYDNATGIPDGRIWVAGDQTLGAADFILKASKPPAATLAFVSAAAALGPSAAHITAAHDTWTAHPPMLGRPAVMAA